MDNLIRSNTRGFTLLEVLVAVAILAIAMVAILKANVQSLDALTKSRETSTASLLAASKLAEVEAVGAASWVEMQGDFGKEYPDYTWEVESSRSELEGVMRIAVIVQRSKGGVGNAVRIEERAKRRRGDTRARRDKRKSDKIA
jgi:general secretion pathway protein I